MPIKGFEEETAPLNEYERETLLPVMVRALSKKIGVENAVTNKQIVAGMKAAGFEIKDARVRKIINAIRREGLVDGLIASSKGYYRATSVQEVVDYIESLMSRESAIKEIRVCMQDYAAKVRAQQ